MVAQYLIPIVAGIARAYSRGANIAKYRDKLSKGYGYSKEAVNKAFKIYKQKQQTKELPNFIKHNPKIKNLPKYIKDKEGNLKLNPKLSKKISETLKSKKKK